MEPLQLTAAQEFEIERMSRIIDSTNDVKALRALSKQLLTALMVQKAATAWAIKQVVSYGDQYHG